MTENYFVNGYEHWKGTLSETDKKAYNELLIILKMATKTYKLRTKDVRADHLDNILECIRRDHPEIFWIQKLEYGYNYVERDNVRYIDNNQTNYFKYFLTNKEIRKYRSLIQRNINNIVDEARKIPRDEDRIKYVHDKIIQSIKFAIYPKRDMKKFLKYQSLISVFERKEAVCLGFSHTFKTVMDRLGIYCYVNVEFITKKLGHAWNKVYLNHQWLNIDVTNDRGYNNTPVYYHYLVANYTLIEYLKEKY